MSNDSQPEPDELRKIINNLSDGDKIEINDRKMPMEVEKIGENKVFISGPQSGEYSLIPSSKGRTKTEKDWPKLVHESSNSGSRWDTVHYLEIIE